MASDKDLRDNTRAMNNLAAQMASFTKICTELNKNLMKLGRTQKPEPDFQNYLGQTLPSTKLYLDCDLCSKRACCPGETALEDNCKCCELGHDRSKLPSS